MCDDSDSFIHVQVNPVTAYGLLEALAVPKGQWLLQTAAGSVLGRLLIALAKRKGVKTINVVRRSAQREELLKLGYGMLPIPRQGLLTHVAMMKIQKLQESDHLEQQPKLTPCCKQP